MFMFFLLVLATIGVHRIYNYESLFSGVRRLIGARWYLKPIWCASCNPVWMAASLVAFQQVTPEPWSTDTLMVLAAYPWIRLMVWVYLYAYTLLPTPTITLPNPPVEETKPEATVVPAKDCPGCTAGQKASQEIKKEQDKNLAYDRRFVLLTPMISDWSPSYSLASVILDQARMLAADEKNLVQVWVTTVCNLHGLPTDLPKNVEIKKVLPPIPLTADHVDDKAKDIFFSQVIPRLLVLGNATIIAHDLLFVSSYLTIAACIHEKLAGIAGFKWFHFCHSAPSLLRPTGPKISYRGSLPEGHRLLCLASSQVNALASYYGVDRSRVSVVPNARDLRTLLDVTPRIASFIARHKLLEADVVQVFPLSTPRANAKGLSHVIKIFAEMAKTKKVRLVVANAHANNNEATLVIARNEAHAFGLPSDALVFVSQEIPEAAVYGLPTYELQALFQTSNLFIFPTVSEACSMTLMEAAVAGCHLVLNESTPSLFDIVPKDACRTFRWGSLVDDLGAVPAPVPAVVAATILDDLAASLSNRSKRSVLRTQSLEAIGARLRAVVTADAPA